MSTTDPTNKALTYSSYLELDQLFELQRPRTDEQDEMLFIIIHQVYELWFKQVLHELGYLQKALEQGDLRRVLADFKRILTILKTLVAQVDVLETMSPVSFLTFRNRLESASGFQSAQFRELEFLLGHKRPSMLEHHPEGSPGRRRLEELFSRPTLWDSFARFVSLAGYVVPEEVLGRDVSLPVVSNPGMQEALLSMYHDGRIETQVCELMVDFDEGLQEWRYRHVKMVERTIGRKPGTGGSEGVGYLQKTLFQPLFPDLWEIRTRL